MKLTEPHMSEQRERGRVESRAIKAESKCHKDYAALETERLDMTSMKAPKETEMQQTKPEVDALTIDSNAMRARTRESPPQLQSPMDAINAAGAEMNAMLVNPDAVAQWPSQPRTDESELMWVN